MKGSAKTESLHLFQQLPTFSLPHIPKRCLINVCTPYKSNYGSSLMNTNHSLLYPLKYHLVLSGGTGIPGCENLLIYYENSVGLIKALPRWIYDLDIFIIYGKGKGLFMISNSLFNSFQKEGHFAPQYVQYHIYGT